MSRRRFVVAATGAALVGGCSSSPTAAPTSTPPVAEEPAETGAAESPQAAVTDVPESGAADSPQAGVTDSPEAAVTESGAASPTDSVAPGEGAVLSIDGAPVAVYKDDQGGVVLLSPKCPHAGCEVVWNAGDKTWDCPCHDSRFSPTGDLIEGPAREGLAAAS